VAGLGDIGSVRRVLEIAVLDVLGLDNSLARSKVLIGAAGAAAKLLEAEREQGWRWWDREEGSRLLRTIGHAARAGMIVVGSMPGASLFPGSTMARGDSAVLPLGAGGRPPCSPATQNRQASATSLRAADVPLVICGR